MTTLIQLFVNSKVDNFILRYPFEMIFFFDYSHVGIIVKLFFRHYNGLVMTFTDIILFCNNIIPIPYRHYTDTLSTIENG